MKVFVTGASGLLGGRLAQVLASRGDFVRILARPSNDLRHLAGLPIEVVHGTLADSSILRSAMAGITHVFHCAARAADWGSWRSFHDPNVAGTENVLRAAAECATLDRFLHVSTTDVYGYPVHPCDESQPMLDVGLPYNRTKCLAERAVWGSGLPVAVVRPATIYGPRSVPFGSELAKLIRQGLMAVIDGGRAPGGFLYVDNAVDGLIAAATAPGSLGRAYNLSDGTGVTWRNYVDRLAAGIGQRRPGIDLPSGAAVALAAACEAPQRCLGIPWRPLLTRHAVYLLSRDQEFPIGRARAEIEFSPAVSFDEGLSRMVEWLGSGSS